MKIRIPCTITALQVSHDHGRVILHPDTPANGMGSDDLVLKVSADQFAAIQVGLPAKVTLTLESPGETTTAAVSSWRLLTEDEVKRLIATGGALETPVLTGAPAAPSTPSTVPSEKDLTEAGRVAALAAMKAVARCAETAQADALPDTAETLARAARTFSETVKGLRF